MKAQDVINSYVTDVAIQLPARLRDDVACELRSQLRDELAGKSDAASALSLVRRFGRPGEAAARYSTPYALVDPADTRSFIVAAIAGAFLIPPVNARLPISVDRNTASLLFLAWIGALVLFFAARSWAIRRWPDHFAWTPTPSRKAINVPAELGMVLCLIVLETVYLAPGAVAAFVSGGHLDASRFAYTASFLQPLRLWGFAAMVPVAAALHLAAALTRRWTRVSRAFASLFLLSAGIQLGWHASYGAVFADPAIDATGRLAFQLAGGALVLGAMYSLYRQWTHIELPEAERDLSPA
jgi:hypothetical protein